MSDAPVLAADLGGTRARVALFAAAAGATPRLLVQEAYPTREHSGLGEILARFLDRHGAVRPVAACLGVAGAVHGNRAWLTNLGWEVEGGALGRAIGVPVELVNDLVATALGMPTLGGRDLMELNPAAAAPEGNGVLLGAGTGMGMALLVRRGDRFQAVPSEGGHVELAARDEEQWRLRLWLSERIGGRVSVERVVSGSGLQVIYEFLVSEGMEPAVEVARRLAAGEDAGAVIGEAGLAGSCPVSVRTLDLFASFYGAVAGDMALLTVARGGVFLGGGVSVHLADKLADGTFLRAFLDKGRLSHFVERVPVQVILRPDTALWGAACRAAELVGGAGHHGAPKVS